MPGGVLSGGGGLKGEELSGGDAKEGVVMVPGQTTLIEVRQFRIASSTELPGSSSLLVSSSAEKRREAP